MNPGHSPSAALKLQQVAYETLNARQKETYNFQKISARLADYGYNCILLSDDWQGADFLAYHNNGSDFYRVQLKGRLTLNRIYEGKDLYLAFWDRKTGRCYVYPHDEFAALVEATRPITETESWVEKHLYSWPSVPAWAAALLAPFEIPAIPTSEADA